MSILELLKKGFRLCVVQHGCFAACAQAEARDKARAKAEPANRPMPSQSLQRDRCTPRTTEAGKLKRGQCPYNKEEAIPPSRWRRTGQQAQKLRLAGPQPQADDEDVGKVYDAQLMRRLGHFVRPYWLQAAIASLSVSLKSLCDVAGPILVMVAVDRYLAPEAATGSLQRRRPLGRQQRARSRTFFRQVAVQGVTRLAAIYLALLVSAYLFQFVQVYLMQWIGPEDHVRSAPRHLPPHAAHARRLL